ncbi:MAG: hypothetical protein JSS11_08255 [Verrucomicrobia bacterium]|nr:hypothetical protein [Verrucomicrobiota bacterium]
MSTLLDGIVAEVNASAGRNVISSTQTAAAPAPDAPDAASGTPAATRSATRKPDDFCTRYAHLITAYGEPVSFNENGSITLNEMLFVAKFAEDQDVIFSPEENRFYAYGTKTGLWSQLTEGGMRLRIHRDVFDAAKGEGFASEMGFKLTNRQLTALTNLLKGQCERRDAFNITHNLIHVRNGMLDLSSGTPALLPFAPNYRSRNQIPYDYDPKATCPRFLNDLLKPALPDEDIDLLQRIAGSILIGGNRAQRIVIIYGLAGGGKSTLFSVIELVIPSKQSLMGALDLLTDEKTRIPEPKGYSMQKAITPAVVSFAEAAARRGLDRIKILALLDYHTDTVGDRSVASNHRSEHRES